MSICLNVYSHWRKDNIYISECAPGDNLWPPCCTDRGYKRYTLSGRALTRGQRDAGDPERPRPFEWFLLPVDANAIKAVKIHGVSNDSGKD